ncbi:hypothetical protein D6829_02715 [Candidatus Pacearchaeota archaeon]|nr:MAG: hypothetical protein D6829_02715 [Candidatus Pacearchaeota archaeon]
MKRGQVWVETVIYTLIGLAIIGIVLALVKPKIDEKKDIAAIEQAIDSLNILDSKIFEIQTIPGNKRVVTLKIGKGDLLIDAENDAITWELESNTQYSEVGSIIKIGDLNVLTKIDGNLWKVYIQANYSSINLTYNGVDKTTQVLSAAKNPYKITLENVGKQNRKTVIDIGGF